MTSPTPLPAGVESCRPRPAMKTGVACTKRDTAMATSLLLQWSQGHSHSCGRALQKQTRTQCPCAPQCVQDCGTHDGCVSRRKSMFYQPCCGIIHDVHMEMTLVHTCHAEKSSGWSTTSRMIVKRKDQQHANANYSVKMQNVSKSKHVFRKTKNVRMQKDEHEKKCFQFACLFWD